MEADKKAKYSPFARLRGASFPAFVMDSYGSWGKQAVEVLGLLKDLLLDKNSRVLAAQTLAVALQRGIALGARWSVTRACGGQPRWRPVSATMLTLNHNR